MKELTVISGKGGTGKTCITACLAALMENKVLADCDVDASNLHLMLDPQIREEHEFRNGQTAEIDQALCINCGLCREVCRFGAVNDAGIDSSFCEGCGFCYHVCPSGAIQIRQNVAGTWYVSDTRYGILVHAKLGIARENSGKLVATVRQKAAEAAKEQGADYILVDGPPGIGCPVISSLTGSSIALILTEPTMSGLHDLNRIIELCGHFDVPAYVCINKYDINEENTKKINRYCREMDITVIGNLPYDPLVTEAMVLGKPLVDYTRNNTTKVIENIRDKLTCILCE